MKGPRRWQIGRGPSETVRTAILAVLIATLLASSAAVVAAARALDIAPNVGDILVFRPGARMPTDWSFTVNKTSGMACVLTPPAMASEGGSLVVEQRLDGSQTYRVHWAGGRTSDGVTDCGRSADLMLQREEVQLLANAVGGPGVEHRVFSYF